MLKLNVHVLGLLILSLSVEGGICGNPDPPLSGPMASCENFGLYSDFGKVTAGVQKGECTVTCTFSMAYNPNAGGYDGMPARPPPPPPPPAPPPPPPPTGYVDGPYDPPPPAPPPSYYPSPPLPSDFPPPSSYDAHYGNGDPVSDISLNGGGYVDIQVDIATSALEPCGTDKVCLGGKCIAVLPEYQRDCSINVGNGAVAVESPKSCQITCLKVFTDYSSGSPSKKLLTVNLQEPDRAVCGTKGMCNAGYCMSESLFPEC